MKRHDISSRNFGGALWYVLGLGTYRPGFRAGDRKKVLPRLVPKLAPPRKLEKNSSKPGKPTFPPFFLCLPGRGKSGPISGAIFSIPLLGLGTQDSRFVIFDPQNGPLYTLSTPHSKGQLSISDVAPRFGEKGRNDTWYHFHACTVPPLTRTDLLKS